MQTIPAQGYARKLAAAHAEAQAAGVKRRDYDTWADLALRRLGLRVPPTLYAPLGWVGFWLAVYFAVAWGLAMHFLIWSDDMHFGIHIVISGIAGVLFGFFMALYQRYFRRKHHLTPWDQL